jgi:hypothetical protein
VTVVVVICVAGTAAGAGAFVGAFCAMAALQTDKPSKRGSKRLFMVKSFRVDGVKKRNLAQ